jgi:RNA polymerase sigma-70 factor (ECF subfamily)
MASFRQGDQKAGAKLIEIFYPELRRMAAAHMRRERPEHSWQPTVLVNELFLEMTKIKALRPSEATHEDDKAAFLALAGQLMRRLLIHHARPLAKKAVKVPLWEEVRATPEKDLAEIEHMLQRLAAIDPIIRTVVEMKVFEGHTAEEIARRVGCSAVTVHRRWQFAKHWMQSEI